MIRGEKEKESLSSRGPRLVAPHPASLGHSLPHYIRDARNQRHKLGQMRP